MASPITFKNVTVPSLDTSNIGAAAGRITDSLGSIGTGIDSLSQGVQSNFAVRQANAARDIQRKIRQDQTANRANTLFGLKGLEDSDIARSLGLGVNKAGNLSFGETQSDAQLSTPENLARIEKAFGGARPDLVEQFAPNDPNIFLVLWESGPFAKYPFKPNISSSDFWITFSMVGPTEKK
jgi:hypothetical protein